MIVHVAGESLLLLMAFLSSVRCLNIQNTPIKSQIVQIKQVHIMSVYYPTM